MCVAYEDGIFCHGFSQHGGANKGFVKKCFIRQSVKISQCLAHSLSQIILGAATPAAPLCVWDIY